MVIKSTCTWSNNKYEGQPIGMRNSLYATRTSHRMLMYWVIPSSCAHVKAVCVRFFHHSPGSFLPVYLAFFLHCCLLCPHTSYPRSHVHETGGLLALLFGGNCGTHTPCPPHCPACEPVPQN